MLFALEKSATVQNIFCFREMLLCFKNGRQWLASPEMKCPMYALSISTTHSCVLLLSISGTRPDVVIDPHLTRYCRAARGARRSRTNCTTLFNVFVCRILTSYLSAPCRPWWPKVSRRHRWFSDWRIGKLSGTIIPCLNV